MKKKNITIEGLARIVKKGFNGVDLRFDNVDKRFDIIEDKLESYSKSNFLLK